MNTIRNPRSRRILVVAFVLFILASCLSIHPAVRRPLLGYHSSQLVKVVTKDGDTERTDYVDSRGNVTAAADAGYATRTKTQTDRGVLERFYDENGEPVRRYTGNYAVLREYDSGGNNTRITYLGADGSACSIREGYATEELEYNESNQIVGVRYYSPEGEPVCTALYGYGTVNEYDENGLNVRTTFTDPSGNPMMTGQGCASVIRQYYPAGGPDSGRVENEFYFDDRGEPVALSLGQYGLHKEYNELGQGKKLTYLDAEGKPATTKKGYATVARTFSPDNNVETEMYYDTDGNPVALTEGQYGIKRENGQTVYLDRNGRETFNLKKLLYNHSLLVIVFAAAAVCLSAMAARKWNTVLLVFYLLVIAYMTLMYRDSEGEKQTELLWYYRHLLTSGTARADIIKNIWLFIPLGAILYRLYPRKVILLIPLALSVIIEMIQYAAGIGYCELDDVISNTLGGGLGYLAGELAAGTVLRIRNRKSTHSA